MAIRLYTKNGDSGTTLIGERGIVPKDSHLIDTIGSLDSFLTSLDQCRLSISPNNKNLLEDIQNKIISLSTELLMRRTNNKITSKDIEFLEEQIDKLEGPIPTEFVRFNNKLSCDLNEARVRCRELERKLVKFLKGNEISKDTFVYVNRLSDFLFCLAFHHNDSLSIPP